MEFEGAERTALADANHQDIQRLLDEMKQGGKAFSRRPSKEEYAKKDAAAERELEALRREHRRLCEEAGREPGWLFPELWVMPQS